MHLRNLLLFNTDLNTPFVSNEHPGLYGGRWRGGVGIGCESSIKFICTCTRKTLSWTKLENVCNLDLLSITHELLMIFWPACTLC